jgi:hypothetical protein
LLAAAAMGLLAGCAVYPDEVSDSYGGAYYGGGFYDYPGHYYSYYPGYYAYCPPVHVPRHYWSYWRKHRHWPDGWNHGHGGHGHAGGWHGDKDRDRDGDRDRPGRNGDRPGRDRDDAGAGGQQDQGTPDRIGFKGKPNNPQAGQGEGYRMPRLANNPAQVRGQFSRAQAAARHEWAASRAAGGDGAWRGGDSKADRAMSKAERKADRAAARGSDNYRSDGGSRNSGSSYRGTGGGSGGQGWSGGSGGGGSRGGGRGR